MTGPVRSVSQAFAILRLLARTPAGLTLSQIARALALSPSSCLNLLRTLVGEEMIERSSEDQRYRTRAAWHEVDFAGSAVERVCARAAAPMRSLAEREEATIGLWHAVSPDRLALVALAESGAATRIHMVIGQRQPIGGGASGRALAASETLDPAEVERRYRAVRWQHPLSLDDYRRAIARAAQDGFAVDDGFGHSGITSISCRLPLPGRGRFCLSASIFAGSRSAAGIAELGRRLVEVATEIGASAG